MAYPKVIGICHSISDQALLLQTWLSAHCRFFKRYNKAVLDKTAIDREKARLEKENEDLRALLKSYLDGISVNDAVLNNPANPLLVVNQRLQLTLAERRRNRGSGSAAAMRSAAASPVPQQSASNPQQLLVVQAVSGR